ncbi:sulfurtransferase [Streptomyces sp. GC420]|nr:sulfurtransferase [Streptomyces sp. GC420]
MDTYAVGTAVPSLSTPGTRPGAGAEAAAMARQVNELGQEPVKDHPDQPDRLGHLDTVPLPDPDAFGAAMRRAGVSSARPVVVYDGGHGWAAARAWWLLTWAGHPSVRVLDGGLAAWTAAGGEVTREVPAPGEGDFVPEPGALGLLDADGAAALARTGLLLDARAAERYRGETEPIDPVAGHIPGAVPAPTTQNVAEDGCFLPAGALRERFAALGATGPAPVGVYCGSGVSAAHQILALTLAGIPAALYAGSWSEWISDPSRPVATGPEPG